MIDTLGVSLTVRKGKIEWVCDKPVCLLPSVGDHMDCGGVIDGEVVNILWVFDQYGNTDAIIILE